MARYSKLLVMLFSVLLTISCQEGGEAGDLFGQWRMKGSDQLYLSFSGSVTHLLRTGAIGVFGNFQHTGDSLFIQCYSADGLPEDTTIVEDNFGFRPFNDIRLKIEELDSDHLRLSKGHQSWSFNQY